MRITQPSMAPARLRLLGLGATLFISASSVVHADAWQNLPQMQTPIGNTAMDVPTAAAGEMGDDVTGGDYTVSASEVRDGDFTVTGGNLVVDGTLAVRGNLVVTGGDLSVRGKLVVKGSLTVTGGDIDTRLVTTALTGDTITLNGGRIYVGGKTILTGGERLGNGAKLPSLVAQIDPLLDPTLYGDSELGVLESIVASDKEFATAKKAIIARFNTGDLVDSDIEEALLSRTYFFDQFSSVYLDTPASGYAAIVTKVQKTDTAAFKRYITLTPKLVSDLKKKIDSLTNDTAKRTYADQAIGKANLAIENPKTPKAQLRKQKAIKEFYETYIDTNLTPEATVTNVSLEILPAKN